MLSLHQLTCFLATYEHGSLTAAAEELGYAQPSVSEQIRALEKSLGVQLFRRVGRGVVPTTVADTLRPHAERVLGAVGADHGDGRGERADDAHQPAAVDVPLAEGVVRMRMPALDERPTVVGVQRGRPAQRALLGHHHTPFG